MPGRARSSKSDVSAARRTPPAVLIASGYHLADGTVLPPAVGPIGVRTREVK